MQQFLMSQAAGTTFPPSVPCTTYSSRPKVLARIPRDATRETRVAYTHHLHFTTIMAPRNPLRPIFGNKQPKKELSSTQRALIISAHFSGKKPATITRELRVPDLTVQYTLKNATPNYTGISKARAGRPKATTSHDERIIVREARLHP
ncbi:uncharacterized protein IWZ02DRAFT_433309 [Phyllosticta citriasiana]|uniref:uncharacterized protein n=1 Tax=Phyllosticta citriasiana TaxID=595635 RepID=UPI0030FDCA1B